MSLEGRGVTNYSTDKPSNKFTPTTTEFDDALLQRNIVTFEQCMIAKGASPFEAQRLRLQKEEDDDDEKTKQTMEQISSFDDPTPKSNDEDDDKDDDDDDESDISSDDEFLKRYRSKRLSELQQQQQNQCTYGEVVHITRSEWTSQINEASKLGYVIIHLSYSSGDVMDAAVSHLARRYPHVKFVSIPYEKAVGPKYPKHHLPTIFVYRDGELKEQMIGISNVGSERYLEWKLGQLGVIETEIEKEDVEVEVEEEGYGKYRGKSGSQFGGMMAVMATKCRYEDEDEGDV